ncbi:hypothetical protein DN824_20505 [Stutzerimonas nosocomialis]|uniref:hypothetical protein n=1 Tax=Stutzerimonas nosocomialis TaxID=1056496 RepID=UPI001107D711|nr:hypothetical protein [Stutzerimonas nosocomialis]TLX54866.1 hypothetical protein DN824_20505 [Stutzerimonas nosocomialis]
MAEIQQSPDDCPKCGVNYAGYARHQEKEKATVDARAAELARMAPTVREAILNYSGAQPVVVVDVNMRFWSMVKFMVKWAIAAIPAAMILGFLFATIFAFVNAAPEYMRLKDRAETQASSARNQPTRIEVPVEADGQFFELGRVLENSIAAITVRKVANDGGEQYSVFVVDCAAGTGVIRSVASSRSGLQSGSKQGQMAQIEPYTPRFYIAKHACRDAPNMGALFR